MAIEIDESNPEGYQVMADYHLVKSEITVTPIDASRCTVIADLTVLTRPLIAGSERADKEECVTLATGGQGA